MAQTRPRRSSEPINPGSVVAVTTSWTAVLDADDADLATKFILQNNSDTDIEIALANDATDGIILESGGGAWEEREYAGPVWAKHGGSGTKDLTVLIF